MNWKKLPLAQQVAKNTEDISTLNSKFVWTTFFNESNVPVGDTYASTGKTFTLTKTSIVQVSMIYGTGRPLALGVKTDETAGNMSLAIAYVNNTDISGTGGLQVTALLPAGTYYIWAKSSASSGSTIIKVAGMPIGD